MEEPVLPPPPPVKVAFTIRLDPAAAAALHKLAGLRRQRPGIVARDLLHIHAPRELSATSDALSRAEG